MAAIDDATGKVVAAFCCPAETSRTYLNLLEHVVVRWGAPASVYRDRHGTLKRNDSNWSLAEQIQELVPIMESDARAMSRSSRLIKRFRAIWPIHCP